MRLLLRRPRQLEGRTRPPLRRPRQLEGRLSPREGGTAKRVGAGLRIKPSHEQPVFATDERSPARDARHYSSGAATAAERRALVEDLEEYWNGELSARVATESLRKAPGDPEALELAKLALLIADHLPEDYAERRSLKGYA